MIGRSEWIHSSGLPDKAVQDNNGRLSTAIRKEGILDRIKSIRNRLVLGIHPSMVLRIRLAPDVCPTTLRTIYI